MKEKLLAVLKKPRVVVGLATLIAGAVTALVPAVSEEVVYTVLAVGAGLLSPEAGAAVKALKPKPKE